MDPAKAFNSIEGYLARSFEVKLSCHECHLRIKQFSCRLYLHITIFKAFQFVTYSSFQKLLAKWFSQHRVGRKGKKNGNVILQKEYKKGKAENSLMGSTIF